VWAVCDSATGYTIYFEIYEGKGSEQAKDDQEDMGIDHPYVESEAEAEARLRQGGDVVIKMLNGGQLREKGQIIVADNFFSSISLAKALVGTKTAFIGTARPHLKDWPKSVTSVKGDKPGTTRWKAMETEGGVLTAFYWMDKHPVHLISTVDSPLETVTISRKRKGFPSGEETIKKPKIVHR